MLANILGWLVLVAVVVLFGWLTWRAWRVRRAILKWPAVVLGGLLTRLLALVAGVIGRGLYIVYAPRPAPAIDLTVERTPERLARGEHLAASLCAAWHTETGERPLSGGHNLSADAKMPLGDIYPPNLTPAGPLSSLSDGDIWRIFRFGVFPNGRPTGPGPVGPNLRVAQGWTAAQFIVTLRTGIDPSGHALQPPMPWKIYGRMDDDELTAVYHFLQGLPLVACH